MKLHRVAIGQGRFASQVATLEPGDIIATGTRAEIGFLAPGEEVDSEGVGVLRDPVALESEERE